MYFGLSNQTLEETWESGWDSAKRELVITSTGALAVGLLPIQESSIPSQTIRGISERRLSDLGRYLSSEITTRFLKVRHSMKGIASASQILVLPRISWTASTRPVA